MPWCRAYCFVVLVCSAGCLYADADQLTLDGRQLLGGRAVGTSPSALSGPAGIEGGAPLSIFRKSMGHSTNSTTSRKKLDRLDRVLDESRGPSFLIKCDENRDLPDRFRSRVPELFFPHLHAVLAGLPAPIIYFVAKKIFITLQFP